MAAALVTAAWAHLGRRTFAIAPRDLLLMTLVGATLALYQVCYFAAIAETGVAIATLVTCVLALGGALAGTALLMVGSALAALWYL